MSGNERASLTMGATRDCKYHVGTVRQDATLAPMACLASGLLWFSCFSQPAEAAADTNSADTMPNDKGEQLQEVVVSGSLIARPRAHSEEAVTIVSADSLKNQGVMSIEQALVLISANQTNDSQRSNASTGYTGGGSYASLRGLGASTP